VCRPCALLTTFPFTATVISEDLRKTLEQRNAAATAADEAPPMSSAERRQHSAVIAEILEVPPLPGLVVTRSPSLLWRPTKLIKSHDPRTHYVPRHCSCHMSASKNTLLSRPD